MIESIYSNESGDAGKNSKTQPTFKMPKNIRQIGKSSAVKKIYVEDYVITYVKQLAGGDYSGCKIAVLVGQCIKLDNCRNIFISGAVEVKDIDTSNEITFTNDTWTSIYDNIKKYFVEAEIVGWFIGGPGYLLEDEEKILKLHVDNFAGQDKILLAFDNMEREEAFYSFENNKLCRQEGYYIYYEKNEEMQSYMVEYKKEQSAEASYDDRVSRDIRAKLQSKKTEEVDSKSVTRLMYAAGTLLAVIVLIVGAAILSNYDQMKSMQDTLNYLTRNMEEIQTMFDNDNSVEAVTDISDESQDTVEADSEGEGSDAEESDVAETDMEEDTESSDQGEQNLQVEVVPGDVEPVEDADSESGDETASAEDKEDEKENPSSGEDLAVVTEKPAAQDTEKVTEASDNAEETTAEQPEVKYYTVKSGDTLADISFKLYNTYTKVKKIMELNNITDQDLIYVGQKLIVP